jgi:hypothetical protein
MIPKIFLRMASDGKAVEVSLMGEDQDHKIPVVNIPQLGKAIGDLGRKYDLDINMLFDCGFSHSSSMNWPKEYTKDPELLKFVEELMR